MTRITRRAPRAPTSPKLHRKRDAPCPNPVSYSPQWPRRCTLSRARAVRARRRRALTASLVVRRGFAVRGDGFRPYPLRAPQSDGPSDAVQNFRTRPMFATMSCDTTASCPTRTRASAARCRCHRTAMSISVPVAPAAVAAVLRNARSRRMVSNPLTARPAGFVPRAVGIAPGPDSRSSSRDDRPPANPFPEPATGWCSCGCGGSVRRSAWLTPTVLSMRTAQARMRSAPQIRSIARTRQA